MISALSKAENNMPKQRIHFFVLFAIILAIIFWSQSRAPALTDKAQMGLRNDIGALAFNILLPISEDHSRIERILRSTVNWGFTNWKGMLFGLLLAAAILGIITHLKQVKFRSPWLNTLAGLFMGAPLGVCVNCATPIAQGMYQAGAALETTLATLFSSPTLNIIVLTMIFSFLPWQIALSYLLCVFILIASIPLLAKISLKNNLAVPSKPLPKAFFAHLDLSPDTRFSQALLGALYEYYQHFISITKLALPFMLLAGFLGAIVIELVPFEQFATLEIKLFSLFMLAMIATFLPVPIAFNVIIVIVLLNVGMHPGYAAVLLFALSSFSIYPALVIGRSISIVLSLNIAIVVIVLATTSGFFIAHIFEEINKAQQIMIEKGILEGNIKVYKKTIAICNQLTDKLQIQCFNDHIAAFQHLLSDKRICLTRPDKLSKKQCQDIVFEHNIFQQALAKKATKPCLQLDSAVSQSICRFKVVFQQALFNKNIDSCNALKQTQLKETCQSEFIKSRLLAIPDSAICSKLPEQEQKYCHINFMIQRFAATSDFSGCDAFDNEHLREHCRYVTASSMVGWNKDSSGCQQIKTIQNRKRCQSLIIAWQAEKNQSFLECNKITLHDLKSLCLKKVSKKKITQLLMTHMIVPTEDTSLVTGTTEQANANDKPLKSPPKNWQAVYTEDGINITRTAFALPPHRQQVAMTFKKIEATKIGITEGWNFHLYDFFEPFLVGKGIASGDFNDDLWPDVVMATEQGVLFYQNYAGKFQQLTVNQHQLKHKNVFIVTLFDADNNGTQDLFASTYGEGNFLLLNLDNHFSQTRLIKLSSQRLTMAAGFADIDKNGQIDIVLGNWSSGIEQRFNPQFSANKILYRQQNNYRITDLKEVKGESLSVLLSDINNDNFVDLLIGNDMYRPDQYYLGSRTGFKPIQLKQNIIPATPTFTMSIISADFNNDMTMDIFATDMSFSAQTQVDYCASVTDKKAKTHCQQMLRDYALFSKGSPSQCQDYISAHNKRDCYAMFSVKSAKMLNDKTYCKYLQKQNSSLHNLCQYLASTPKRTRRINQKRYLTQIQQNVLLLNQQNKSFTESAKKYTVANSYWSWNSKAADLDNDGWQDIFIGNGFHFGDGFYEIHENIVFHNQQGKSFQRVEKAWGLDSNLNTPSFTYLDADLDGDLDILTTSILALPQYYENQASQYQSIAFKLVSDTNIIGSKITITYGNQQQQIKELRLSGGFMSYDNPILYFGLTHHQQIDKLSILWPDNHLTIINKVLKSGYYYKIIR